MSWQVFPVLLSMYLAWQLKKKSGEGWWFFVVASIGMLPFVWALIIFFLLVYYGISGLMM